MSLRHEFTGRLAPFRYKIRHGVSLEASAASSKQTKCFHVGRKREHVKALDANRFPAILQSPAVALKRFRITAGIDDVRHIKATN